MGRTNLNQILSGLLITISLSLGGWALKAVTELSTQVALLSQQIEQMTDGKETDKMHWRYLSSNRDEINRVYYIISQLHPEKNIELPRKPDLE